MSHEDDLYALLTKKADETKLESNEDAPTAVGTNTVYEDPEDRQGPGKSDSPWGEPGPQVNGANAPAVFSSAADTSAKDVKQEVPGRVLSGKSQASSVDQALMSANLDHVSSGDFRTSSIQLKEKSKVASPPTLIQQVLHKAGRL